MGTSVTVDTTSMVLNPVSSPAAQRTYVVFGLERGRTSPVAGVLRALGLYLGEIDEGNNEDKAFHGGKLGEMRATIAERNAEHDVWGWKYPTAVNYLPALMKAIRNPFFVVVYRDAVATALSRGQWDGEFLRRSPRMALHEASTLTNTNTSFALATGRPCLLVSNEKAERFRYELIDELADFLCFPRPDEELRERILAYIEPGSYKPFEEYFPATSNGSVVPEPEEESEHAR
ncbi:MAG: hypothetical protein GEV00_12520 [Actinophytocola sp.]|nr:hypothetical protein [Actinophytocola sp.]